MSLSEKQSRVLDTLIEVTGYTNNSIDGSIYPEAVFTHFTDKYLFFNAEGDVTGYISHKDGLSCNQFEQTKFFNDICAFLRGKKNKTYIIDMNIKPMLKMLAIPYTFNHFDPRIYDYS